MKSGRKKPRRTKQRKRRVLPKNNALLAVLGTAVFLVLAAVLANPALRSDLYGLAGITQNAVSLQNIELGADGSSTSDTMFNAASISFLDVGQGDAVLIECGGEFALIDAGSASAEEDLLADLQTLNVPRLRYLVMSHPHEDHIGGMKTVLQNYSVETMLLPDFSKAELPTTSTFEDLMQHILQQGLPSEVMEEGAQYPLGNGVLQVLCGSLENDNNYNLLSPTLLFAVQDFSYLSAGDAERENEEEALRRGVTLSADLFKASHHGSSTSNTLAFMQAVQPDISVITCGVDNRYGHPHREVLDTFDLVETITLSTAESGLIRVLANEQGEMQVQAEYTQELAA